MGLVIEGHIIEKLVYLIPKTWCMDKGGREAKGLDSEQFLFHILGMTKIDRCPKIKQKFWGPIKT